MRFSTRTCLAQPLTLAVLATLAVSPTPVWAETETPAPDATIPTSATGPNPASAATPEAPAVAPPAASVQAERPYELGFQSTVIAQQLIPFHSPYAGPNSLRSKAELKESETYTLFLGYRPVRGLELYFNPEMARGGGIGNALGLAGFTNGEVIRNPALGEEPYPARYFLRWTVSAGGGSTPVEPDENKIGGSAPAHRLVVTAGKVGTNDLFDTNRYANSARPQFMNWALINDAAYDYAADTRGYTHGVALEWIHPDWALRLGSFQMPRVANGENLSWDLVHSRGDQMEGEFHPRLIRGLKDPAVVRVLAYRNVASMGDYQEALTAARGTGAPPDIITTRKEGAVKYGFGFNGELPLADGGETGLFARGGWNDGRKESFAFTEADRHLSLGGQLSGVRWRRPADRWALALALNGLSGPHQRYLAAGGTGFILGDGHLNYGPEQILETYYRFQLTKRFSLTVDYQFINHPGYNRDRGPVSVPSLRAHLEF